MARLKRKLEQSPHDSTAKRQKLQRPNLRYGCCLACGTQDSWKWRTGPDGTRTLCEECFTSYRSKTLPLYHGKHGLSVVRRLGSRPVQVVAFHPVSPRLRYLYPVVGSPSTLEKQDTLTPKIAGASAEREPFTFCRADRDADGEKYASAKSSSKNDASSSPPCSSEFSAEYESTETASTYERESCARPRDHAIIKHEPQLIPVLDCGDEFDDQWENFPLSKLVDSVSSAGLAVTNGSGPVVAQLSSTPHPKRPHESDGLNDAASSTIGNFTTPCQAPASKLLVCPATSFQERASNDHTAGPPAAFPGLDVSAKGAASQNPPPGRNRGPSGLQAEHSAKQQDDKSAEASSEASPEDYFNVPFILTRAMKRKLMKSRHITSKNQSCKSPTVRTASQNIPTHRPGGVSSGRVEKPTKKDSQEKTGEKANAIISKIPISVQTTQAKQNSTTSVVTGVVSVSDHRASNSPGGANQHIPKSSGDGASTSNTGQAKQSDPTRTKEKKKKKKKRNKNKNKESQIVASGPSPQIKKGKKKASQTIASKQSPKTKNGQKKASQPTASKQSPKTKNGQKKAAQPAASKQSPKTNNGQKKASQPAASKQAPKANNGQKKASQPAASKQAPKANKDQKKASQTAASKQSPKTKNGQKKASQPAASKQSPKTNNGQKKASQPAASKKSPKTHNGQKKASQPAASKQAPKANKDQKKASQTAASKQSPKANKNQKKESQAIAPKVSPKTNKDQKKASQAATFKPSPKISKSQKKTSQAIASKSSPKTSKDQKKAFQAIASKASPNTNKSQKKASQVITSKASPSAQEVGRQVQAKTPGIGPDSKVSPFGGGTGKNVRTNRKPGWTFTPYFAKTFNCDYQETGDNKRRIWAQYDPTVSQTSPSKKSPKKSEKSTGSVIHVKAMHINGDVRRFSLSRGSTFSQFEGRLKKLFNLTIGCKIRYKDNEGDWVTVSSQEEMNEFYRVVNESAISPIRVQLTNR